MHEDRIQQAVELFKSGFNCAQAVVAAFADIYDADSTRLLRLSTSFGGGIGRMRGTCGAACGLFMLVGLETGTDDPNNRTAKSHNYSEVQRLAEEFRSENGSLICAELLGLTPTLPITNVSAERPAGGKRPCVEMVRSAASIFARFLESKKTTNENNLQNETPTD